ncbi:hypothetical protein MSG28_000016 [Choristoneura fumiferana]|uniref:Uncharacterized protein n=1 Tax=Choristoneura fumiferana TaxID=7141 RepID=A0ACC0JYP5_CHOFU|nr:hypothetical protein MSG28_000016 [Choristoneura fumiferana]
MKIVSSEEKHEEISPRRSSRIRVPVMWDSEEESEFASPRRKKRRSKEFSDSVIANAIARKEKYNEPGPTQRPYRRIKPTSKVLGNKELRWLQSAYNSQEADLIERWEDGVMTRRSARRKSFEAVEEKKSDRGYDEEEDMEGEEMELEGESEVQSHNVKKLKHLCELGLRAINPTGIDESSQTAKMDLLLLFYSDEDMDADIDEDQELDEELISKLAEVETGSDISDDDEEFYCSTSVSKRPRRSTRLCSGYGGESEQAASPTPSDAKSQPRRSSRKPRANEPYLSEENESRHPAGGDDGSEATCPEEESGIMAQCECETPSNVYASPKDLDEPVFCQAIELVDGVRVGCSHGAARGPAGYAPLVRSGPRAPYILACGSHREQLRRHLCCAACGLFCSQGTFYRCSQNHLFHVECGIPSETRQRPGCPHCGVYTYRWQPVNCDCHKVRVLMKCTNKRVFLPDQRVQCPRSVNECDTAWRAAARRAQVGHMLRGVGRRGGWRCQERSQRTPAYLSFSTLDPAVLEQEPIIPPSLLPSLSVDLESLRGRAVGDARDASALCEAIQSGAPPNELLPLIVSCPDINEPVTRYGGTVAHAAARRGHLAALYLAQYAGASIDACDAATLTPLMRAVRALSKKNAPKVKSSDSDQEMDVDPESDKEDDDKESEGDGASDEDLLKVIRYLVAAGCDVNIPGPEGMTALHTAARYGHVAACEALLGGARAQVDPRDHGGWTPLVWAAEHQRPLAVRLLLEHGADATATDIEGNAAAHWCALAGDAQSLRLLVEASRALWPPSTRTGTRRCEHTGGSNGHVAARQGHYACVVILLAHGARTDVENSAGELPVEVCSGECQSAISLNMQMAIAARDVGSGYRMLCSDLSNGREEFPVPCVNEVDDAPAPDDFTYVTRHVTPRPVAVDDTIDTLQGCTCADGTCQADTCACQLLGVRRWLARGRLAPDFPYHEPPMLFQCHHACACNTKLCTNASITRATQKGSLMVRAAVFRAGGARGWGLRALARVPRGAPVATYCGELLSMADADTRSADHYMFALDLKRTCCSGNQIPDNFITCTYFCQQCEYKVQLCVDAARYGSAARFVNHSCAPNVAPVRVFAGGRDLRLPPCACSRRGTSRRARSSLDLTKRDVESKTAGEITGTFDYGDKFWSVKSKWMRCECGAPECRYPLQSSDDAE